ncbi:hypothetical protein C0991_009724 [Blastosporella zonata]|nr:hypothetical protein C0991_009724 [Blastosporella zonata]
MLPSRLFRNTGIPPVLRSLLTPHPSLPATVAVQLRFRLGVIAGTNAYSTATPPSSSPPSSSTASTSSSSSNTTNTPSTAAATTTSQPLPEKLEPRLSMTFTCTAENCSERSTHQFTKRAYERGIVLVQCPGCKNRHLIADHLGWFKESTQEGKLKTIEDILRDRGETVRRGRLDAGGVVEYTD